MFKNKSILNVLLVFLLVLFSFVYFNLNKGNDLKTDLLKNGIVFEGVITDFRISGNHSFGMIKVNILESNSDYFCPIINDRQMFPYTIKKNVAEIYSFVSDDLKKGTLVKVDSNEGRIIFIYNEKIIYDYEVTIINEETDMNFIKRNSSLLVSMLE